MADNTVLNAGSGGDTYGSDDIGGIKYQRVKLIHGADNTNDGDVALTNPLPIRQAPTIVRLQTDVTRLANTTTYTANTAWADTTPTAGGFTFTGAARLSGGGGTILSATFTTSGDPALLLQGECHLFTTSVTAVADNAAFAVSDAEIKTWLGKIYFSMFDAGNNGACHVSGVGISYVCSGSANLRFLIRVLNAYIPASAEVLTCSLVCAQD